MASGQTTIAPGSPAEALLDGIDDAERAHLRAGARAVAVCGDGAGVLAAAWPALEVTALPAGDERIAGQFDVVVAVGVLERFADPLEVVRTQLLAARDLYLALVPLSEHPLPAEHRSQFRPESFPDRLGAFARLTVRAVDGRQLAVVYGSDAYAAARLAAAPEDLAEALAVERRRNEELLDELERRRAEQLRAEEDFERRLRTLTARAGARAGAARTARRLAATAAAPDTQDAEQLRSELERVRHQYDVLVGSRAWRLGNRTMNAMRRLPGLGRLARRR